MIKEGPKPLLFSIINQVVYVTKNSEILFKAFRSFFLLTTWFYAIVLTLYQQLIAHGYLVLSCKQQAGGYFNLLSIFKA